MPASLWILHLCEAGTGRFSGMWFPHHAVLTLGGGKGNDCQATIVAIAGTPMLAQPTCVSGRMSHALSCVEEEPERIACLGHCLTA